MRQTGNDPLTIGGHRLTSDEARALLDAVLRPVARPAAAKRLAQDDVTKFGSEGAALLVFSSIAAKDGWDEAVRIFRGLARDIGTPDRRRLTRKNVRLDNAKLVNLWDVWRAMHPNGKKTEFAAWWKTSAFGSKMVDRASVVKRLNRALSSSSAPARPATPRHSRGGKAPSGRPT
jgi:hypothetical protein